MIRQTLVIALLWMILGTVVHAAGHVVVGQGDTLARIAAATGTTVDALLAQNGLEPGAEPVVGTILSLPDDVGGEERPALVLSLLGEGTLTPLGGQTVPLQAGAALPKGTVVCTAADSFASVRLALSSSRGVHDDVSLLPRTCITLQSATSRNGRRASLIRLQQGSVNVPANSGSDEPGVVTIQTRAGVTTAPRGGFRVHVEPDAARTEALETALSVIGAGVEQQVGAGQGSRTRVGEAPGPVVALLVAGPLLQPKKGAVLRRPDFGWRADADALEYQLELSSSRDFRALVRLEVVGHPEWEPDRLLLPYRVHTLWWRVSPVDRLGFVGMPAGSRVVELPPGMGP